MLKRELYLSRIRSYYDSQDFIKIISGVRRSGKSTLMNQIIAELEEQGGTEKILLLNLEDYRWAEYLDNPGRFHHVVKELIEEKKYFYVFIDEIQRLKDFQRVIASLKALLPISLFVTGSNSQLLSGELATHLVGRTLDYTVMPFTYSEAMQYCIQLGRTLSLEEYLKWGGIPQRFLLTTETEVRSFLEDLLQSIITKDVWQSRPIKHRELFYNVLSFIMGESGSTISTKNITSYLSSREERVTVQTIYLYLYEMMYAYLIQKVSRFDIAGKKALSTLSKYYAIDPAFITLHRGGRDDLQSRPLETVVYNELVARGHEVYIGKTTRGEVDFIVKGGSGRCYIQVAYLLSSEQTVRREFNAFSAIKDNWPRYVLSLDRLDFSRDGIIHYNLEEFLLGTVSLSFGG
jgi:predicted AAA+ superfamily ATPase